MAAKTDTCVVAQLVSAVINLLGQRPLTMDNRLCDLCDVINKRNLWRVGNWHKSMYVWIGVNKVDGDDSRMIRLMCICHSRPCCNHK